MKCYVEIAVEVDYDASRGRDQTRTDPAEPAELEITKVRLGWIDIFDMMTPSHIEQIESQVWEKLNEEPRGR